MKVRRFLRVAALVTSALLIVLSAFIVSHAQSASTPAMPTSAGEIPQLPPILTQSCTCGNPPESTRSNCPSLPDIGQAKPITFEYDEQLGITFSQNFTSMDYNVTAVEQVDLTLDNGPAYLLSGLSNTGYWYQAGLSWNWSPGQIPGIGFNMNYEVFAPSGSSIFPARGGAGLMSFSGPINQGDRVLVRLYFVNSNVTMAADDENTGSSASEVFSASGGTYFVGLTGATANQHGFFTGLMTEWYHGAPYYGQEQKVIYSNPQVGLSSALMWIDEYDVQTDQSLFASASSLISYSGSSTLQSFVSHNATEYSNAHGFVTGSLNIALTLNYSVYAGGGAGYSAPTLVYVSGGMQRTATLATSSATYFVDNGTQWSVSSLLPGSSSTQRWEFKQSPNQTAILSETLDLLYYPQAFTVFDYRVVGGGTGYSPPTMSYDQLRIPKTTAVGIERVGRLGNGGQLH